VKQSIVVQPRFCSALAMVRMTHNGNRENKAIEGYTPIQKKKEQKTASFCLGITAFSFVG